MTLFDALILVQLTATAVVLAALMTAAVAWSLSRGHAEDDDGPSR